MELWSPSSIELAASPIAAALALRAFLRLLEVDLVTLRDGVADDAVSAPPAATENPAERVAAGAAADEGSANGTAGGTASGTAGGTAVGTPLEIRVDRSDGKSSPRAAASMSSIASAASSARERDEVHGTDDTEALSPPTGRAFDDGSVSRVARGGVARGGVARSGVARVGSDAPRDAAAGDEPDSSAGFDEQRLQSGSVELGGRLRLHRLQAPVV